MVIDKQKRKFLNIYYLPGNNCVHSRTVKHFNNIIITDNNIIFENAKICPTPPNPPPCSPIYLNP